MAVYVSCSLVAYETSYVGVGGETYSLDELVCPNNSFTPDQVLACGREYLVAVRPWF